MALCKRAFDLGSNPQPCFNMYRDLVSLFPSITMSHGSRYVSQAMNSNGKARIPRRYTPSAIFSRVIWWWFLPQIQVSHLGGLAVWHDASKIYTAMESNTFGDLSFGISFSAFEFAFAAFLIFRQYSLSNEWLVIRSWFN